MNQHQRPQPCGLCDHSSGQLDGLSCVYCGGTGLRHARAAILRIKERVMQKSLFVALCELVAEFEGLTARMESGPIKAQLEDVIERFDAIIDKTIGLEVPAATHDT